MRSIFLSVLVFLGVAGAVQACPDWRLNPLYGSFDLSRSQLLNGVSLELTAGGAYSISNCTHIRPATDRGPGYFEAAPDARIFVSSVAGRRLSMWLTSNCDTTLLINTASATWYYDDDDGPGSNGLIYLTAPQNGQIDLWAGMFNYEFCDARLNIRAD